MKVVISGGSGLIGTALSRSFRDAGDDVVILTRNIDRAPSPPTGIRVVGWRPPAPGEWVSEIADSAAVINLAGESVGRWPWTGARKRRLRESRILPTRTLVDAIAATPSSRRPPVLLNASGTDVYLDLVDNGPADERTPPADTYLAQLCVQWEAEALGGESLGVRVALMRTSSVIAPGAAFLRTVSLPTRCFLGGPIGDGQQWVSWVDVSDVIGLYRWAIDHDELRGPINVAAPDPRRQAAFAASIAAVLRRPTWFTTPAWVVRLLLGEQATLALGSRRVWPRKAIESGYVFRRPHLEDALRASL